MRAPLGAGPTYPTCGCSNICRFCAALNAKELQVVGRIESTTEVSRYTLPMLNALATATAPKGRIVVGWVLEVRNNGVRLLVHHKAPNDPIGQTQSEGVAL